jgi:hypothetical protein
VLEKYKKFVAECPCFLHEEGIFEAEVEVYYVGRHSRNDRHCRLELSPHYTTRKRVVNTTLDVL